MLRRTIVTAFLAVAAFAPTLGAQTITTIDFPGAVTTAPQGINSPREIVGTITRADGVTTWLPAVARHLHGDQCSWTFTNRPAWY